MHNKLLIGFLLVLAGLSLSACGAGRAYVRVPTLTAVEFSDSPLKRDAASVERVADGKAVHLICPVMGKVDVAVTGGEKVFYVLNSGGATKNFSEYNWTQLAVIRRYREPFTATLGSRRKPLTSHVVIVILDREKLLEQQAPTENIAVLAGDIVLVPNEGDSIEDALENEFGYALVRVKAIALTVALGFAPETIRVVAPKAD